MREILFRGKPNATNEWIYGDLVSHRNKSPKNGKFIGVIATTPTKQYKIHRVKIDTIGQYTGLKDKNGTKIFEGDILSIPAYLDGEKCVCVYQATDTGIGFEFIQSKRYCLGDNTRILSNEWEDFEIIGNIYDNPELL